MTAHQKRASLAARVERPVEVARARIDPVGLGVAE